MMEKRVYIRENFKLVYKKNSVSAHEWFDHGPTTSYSVVGPTGELARCRTEKGAIKQQKEWVKYYEKFGWPEC